MGNLIVFRSFCMELSDQLPFSLKVENFIDRAVRLKVTNNCPFSCEFCHNEGTELPERSGSRISTMIDPSLQSFNPIEDVSVPDIEGSLGYSQGAIDMSSLAFLKQLGFEQIHLTGGEPSSHQHLPAIIRFLRQNSFTVKMTSNGQFSEEKLRKFVEAGLSGITFSILSLDAGEFLKTQLRQFDSQITAIVYAQKALKKVRDNIVRAQELGLVVKINVVILSTDDTARVDRIIDFARQYKVTINLLPCVLSSSSDACDKQSMEVLACRYAVSRGAHYVKTTRSTNNSGGTHHFVFPDGTLLGVKFIQNKQPELLCASCEYYGKPSCSENFYGLRIEIRGGKPFVRLCVQKSTSQTLMPLESFVHSPLAELAPGIMQ